MIFDKQFNYIKLERQDLPTGRVYISPKSGRPLASVTSILGKTKSEESKTALENWQKFMGLKKAEQIRNDAANVGTLIHNNLERYILNEEQKWGSNMIHKIAKQMAELIIQNGFTKISKIYGQEINLYAEDLFAGTADLIAEVNSYITIVDFKNSLKIKKEEHLDDYFCQCCAYAIAHDEMYGSSIKNARIMMVSRPDNNKGVSEYKEFDLDGLKFQKYRDLWLKRLDQFYGAK